MSSALGPPVRRGNRRLGSLLVALCVIGSGLALPAIAGAAVPRVGPLSVEQDESATTGTAEAVIEPGGLRTEYAFWLEGPRESPFCTSPIPCAPLRLVGTGYVEASVTEKAVSAHVTGLAVPSQWYTWSVTARNAEGEVTRNESFVTGVLSPAFEGTPYNHEISQAAIEGAQQAARAGSERAREASEGSTREASERAARPVPWCVVPRLKGDSLRTARRALDKAHCTLGRVSKPKSSRLQLVVLRQSPRRGVKLGDNARVALTLGS